MATLVFTAIGTAIGGPLGGALGSLLGSQVDRAIAGSPKRAGPRLKELGVSTSSYGTPIPRQHGTIRAPGSIVWATDLAEHTETSGGGKGSPSTTSYSYTVSLAVVLSSRPVARVGRIWADGNLLRGAAGDLKTGGTLRVYTGHGDQEVDPLLASAQPDSPAYRGAAYCVFEDLALGDFGNRIPALTFEIVADDGAVTIDALVDPLAGSVSLDRPLAGLQGFSNEGGAVADALATLDQLYPIACDAGGESLSLTAADRLPDAPPELPPAAAASDGESFAAATGAIRRRQGAAAPVPDGVRYYDPARDYQPGVQRADGRARPGRSRTIEMPGVLAASDARALANGAATRAASARDTMSWRMAELDPALAPGQVVRVPGRAGKWAIESWEWRDQGVELELRKLPRGPARRPSTDPGTSLPPGDTVATPTLLVAFEAPWDGTGSSHDRHIVAALSSASSGWKGAAIYQVEAGELHPVGWSGSRRSVIGTTMTSLPPSPAAIFERRAILEVELASDDFALPGATTGALAAGANRVMIGGELLQYSAAVRTGPRAWRLTGLLRGRGGTEAAAMAGCPAGTSFVLLDGAPLELGGAMTTWRGPVTLGAIGFADSEAVIAELANPELSRRPPTPVHGRVAREEGGGIALEWRRRARGAWHWADEVDVPLVEETESYTVGIGDPALPPRTWQVNEPRLALSPAQWAELTGEFPGLALWVRQIGTHAHSAPLHLTTIA